ncbi:MAG: hypothetical protein ACAH17_01195 [Candidatus Paceibacterota bacterium]
MSGEQILTNIITEVFSPIYQAVVGVTILYFLYGVARYVIELNNPESQTTGRSHLFWGLVGLFIVLSVGGILAFLNGSIGSMFS